MSSIDHYISNENHIWFFLAIESTIRFFDNPVFVVLNFEEMRVRDRFYTQSIGSCSGNFSSVTFSVWDISNCVCLFSRYLTIFRSSFWMIGSILQTAVWENREANAIPRGFNVSSISITKTPEPESPCVKKASCSVMFSTA